MKKIKEYTFEDFVNDRSFVRWVLNPSQETGHFWNEVIERYPEKVNEVKIASEIIISTASEKQFLTDEKVDELWLRIRRSSIVRRKNYRILSYLSAAASFLLLIGFGLWYFELRDTEDHLVDYRAIKAPDHADNQVQLVLSDTSKIYFDDSEATLMYRNDGKLHTSMQEINLQRHGASEKERNKEKIALNQIIVPNGKRTSIIFSDGTKLWLNSGSRAIYPVYFSGKEREIFIEGEAFLEVAPDKTLPFVVKTNMMKVQVLGTSFNIKAYPEEEESSVVLVEGIVEVKAGKQNELQLRPDQLFSYSSVTGLTEVQNDINIFEHIGWKFGWLLCNSESLGSVFTKLSRYYDVTIILEDNEIGSFKINGKLDLKEELNDVLRAVSIAGSFTYGFDEDNKIIIRKK